MKLPDKIKKCPITESVFEIRYTSEMPVDAIFGILYAAIKDIFTKDPTPLPILQLPEKIRVQDPNFKYQPCHKLEKDNFILSIGPRVLTFSNQSPYTGWNEWSKFFYEVISNIQKSKVINKIERLGLRYINFFEGNIFEKTKIEIKIDKNILKEESTNLRTEIIQNDIVQILNIGNSVNIKCGNSSKIGSIIDIDCLYNFKDPFDFTNGQSYRDIIEKLHAKEKELFFTLLKEAFLKELIPIYGG